jgi:hypothetical protein
MNWFKVNPLLNQFLHFSGHFKSFPHPFKSKTDLFKNRPSSSPLVFVWNPLRWFFSTGGNGDFLLERFEDWLWNGSHSTGNLDDRDIRKTKKTGQVVGIGHNFGIVQYVFLTSLVLHIRRTHHKIRTPFWHLKLIRDAQDFDSERRLVHEKIQFSQEHHLTYLNGHFSWQARNVV